MNKSLNFAPISVTNTANQHPQPIPTLSYLIAKQLEKLDIFKKYAGFRYLVDFLRITLANKSIKQSYSHTLEIVAALNNSTRNIVDRDTRHILLTSWKNSNNLKSTLLIDTNKIGAKQILYALIDYIAKVI